MNTRRVVLSLAAMLLVLLAVLVFLEHRGRRASNRRVISPPKVPDTSLEAGTPELRAEEPVKKEPIEHRSDPVPDVFRGDVEVRGEVLTPDGEPVADVAVACRPMCFRWTELSARNAHRAVTDRAGQFTISKLPRTVMYDFRVADAGWFGKAHVRRAVSSAALKVVIRATPYRYERIVCVDERGAPVDTAGAILHDDSNGMRILWGSTGRHQLREFLELKPFGEDDPGLDRHAITVCWSGTKPLGAKVVIPGFAPATVSMQGRSLPEWPASSRLRLKTAPMEAGRTLYRVRFRSPGEDRNLAVLPPLCFRKPNDDIRVVSERSPAFVDDTGIDWQLEMYIRGPRVNHRVAVEGHTTWIIPEWPELGVVTIHYRPNLPDHPESYALLHLAGGGPQPRILYPGIATLGPLPFGQIRLIRVLYLSPKQRLARDDYSFALNAEEMEIRWP